MCYKGTKQVCKNTAYLRKIFKIYIFLWVMQHNCIAGDYFCTQLLINHIIMAKNKNQKRKDAISLKNAQETLRFQVQWGLKKLGVAEGGVLYKLAIVELEYIAELGLTQDLLTMKKLIDGVEQKFGASVTADKAPFAQSIVCIALGIARVSDVSNIGLPMNWADAIAQKLLPVYFSDTVRNNAVAWAKQNGFNTSTYLGKPIAKFSNIYLIIDRTIEA